MQILVIRPGAIGDVLLSFPILQALREHYDNPHITLVSNSAVLPLALEFKVADNVSDFSEIQWSGLFSLADQSALGTINRPLRSLLQQIDMAICWLRDPDHIVEHNLRQAGIQHVIVAPGRPSAGERVHIVEYLASTVGLQENIDTMQTARIFTQVDIWKRAMSHPIAIHPGSGSPQKCWPVHCFAAVIERLLQQNRPVLLLAGPADTGRLECLLAQLADQSPLGAINRPLRYPERFSILADKPLLEVAQRLQQCACYLGNDSGITHLAALLGIPTIALFGPGDPAVWKPVGPTVKVIQGRPLERLSVDVVIEAIDSFYLDG